MSANEALRRARLSSYEYFQKKRWEGKPLSFQLKYAVANYPSFVACGVACMVGFVLSAYKYYSFKGSKRDATRKYKRNYTVKRDDDPNIENIIREKEYGRELFPKY